MPRGQAGLEVHQLMADVDRMSIVELNGTKKELTARKHYFARRGVDVAKFDEVTSAIETLNKYIKLRVTAQSSKATKCLRRDAEVLDLISKRMRTSADTLEACVSSGLEAGAVQSEAVAAEAVQVEAVEAVEAAEDEALQLEAVEAVETEAVQVKAVEPVEAVAAQVAAESDEERSQQGK